MGIAIRSNPTALNAQNKLGNNINDLDRQNRSLATGDRLYQAANDPSALVISEGMRSRIRSLGQATRNANDSISMIQVAEVGLSSIQEMGIRLKELALQTANDTLGDEDRGRANVEFQQLKKEIKRVIKESNFNGRKLLDGSGGQFDFQIGIHNDPKVDQVNYDMSRLLRSADKVSLGSNSITTKNGSLSVLPAIDRMMTEVSGARAFLGGVQNRVQSTVSNLQVFRENTEASNSRIRDTDIAKATADRAVTRIKTNASTGFLSHAKTLPARAMDLLE